MKIISKAYLLVGVLIGVAIFNLFILYNTQSSISSESYSVIRAGDLKTKVETIAALSSSIASGNENDRQSLEREIKEFDALLHTLSSGGQIRGQSTIPIPQDISSEYDEVRRIWNAYRADALEIQAATTYNRDAVDALNYILNRSIEMTLTTDSLIRDLELLDRNYNKHKEIAVELHETAKTIGQSALLISIGEDTDARDRLKDARITFEIGMRKLLNLPLDSHEFAGRGISDEELLPVPRENSESLDHLDILWEAVALRIKTLEARSLYSDEFSQSLSKLNSQRQSLVDSIDTMLDAWNAGIIENRDQGQIVTQSIIVVDIAIFIIVLYTIRKSLVPLGKITDALSRVKEGIYGERIEHASNDEIGQLATTFNTMSETIKIKEEEARRTDIAKDEFLTMITHELKTPLVPIQGYADMLLGGYLGTLSERQRERISIIKSSSSSLLQLISDLLDVQKLELGQLRMKKDATDIQTTVAKSIQTLQPQIEEVGVKVINEVSSITVRHDMDRIMQVLTNLLKNSLKAVMPNAGIIRISSTEEQDRVKITVEDNGAGIPTEKQGKLFTKFYQADASLTREKGGSGLGLSICKGIVEAHGGSIELQSSPSAGTKVTFSLPKAEHAKSPV